MDGWITIGTKLDTREFDKQVNDLESKVEQEEDKLNKSGENVEQSMNGIAGAIGKIGKISTGSFGSLRKVLSSTGSALGPILAGFIALKVQIDAIKLSIKTFTTFTKVLLAPAIITLSTLAKKMAEIIKGQLSQAFSTLKQKTTDGINNLVQVNDKLNQSISSLNENLTEAGNSIASGLAPVIEAIIPAMNNWLTIITNIANGIAQITSSLFGNATTFKKAKQNSDDYAKSLGSVGKAAKSVLAPFDELNVLQSQNGGGGSAIEDMFEDVEIDSKIAEFTKKLKELWDADDIEGLESFGENIGKKVKEQIDNLPAYEWAKSLGENVNKALALANGFLSTNPAKSLGEKIADLVLGFIDGLTPEQVGKFIANIINNGFGLVAGFVEQMNNQNGWKRLGKWLRESLTTMFENLDANTIATAIGGFIEGALDLGIEFFSKKEDWDKVAKKLAEIASKINWMEIATKAVELFILAMQTAVTLFWYFMAGVYVSVDKWFAEKSAAISEKIKTLMQIGVLIVAREGLKVLGSLNEIWTSIKTWFSQNVAPKLELSYWTKKLEPMKKAISTVFKGALNIVIDLVNGLIQKLENALNRIVDRINSLSIVNPFTGEDIWSPHVPKFDFGKGIPHLAKGGIVAQPTHAIIGESGREAVMPLENNTEWIDELASKINAGGNITIRFTGSTAQLVRMLKPELDKEDKRTGKRLIVGGAF